MRFWILLWHSNNKWFLYSDSQSSWLYGRARMSEEENPPNIIELLTQSGFAVFSLAHLIHEAAFCKAGALTSPDLYNCPLLFIRVIFPVLSVSTTLSMSNLHIDERCQAEILGDWNILKANNLAGHFLAHLLQLATHALSLKTKSSFICSIYRTLKKVLSIPSAVTFLQNSL